MPFNLFNISVSFQEYINEILIEKLDIFVITYMDDILIYTNEVDNVNSICWVLKQLRKHFLYANFTLYCLYQEEVRFLNYLVSLQDICIEDEWMEVVRDWPKSQSIRDI